MPKQKKITKKLRAFDLTKPYIKSGFNQAKVARQRGVSRATINEQVHRKPTIDRLQKFLDSRKLDKRLIVVAEEGLAANRVISAAVVVHQNKPGSTEQETPEVMEKLADEKTVDFIDVPDHNARYKFWNGLMQAKGKIKQNGNGAGVKVINIIYAYRNDS